MLVAVRQLTVNDEICKEFADDGGVLAVAAVLDAGAWLRTPAVVRAALGALRQMSSSDSVKTLLAERGGIEKVGGRGRGGGRGGGVLRAKGRGRGGRGRICRKGVLKLSRFLHGLVLPWEPLPPRGPLIPL